MRSCVRSTLQPRKEKCMCVRTYVRKYVRKYVCTYVCIKSSSLPWVEQWASLGLADGHTCVSVYLLGGKHTHDHHIGLSPALLPGHPSTCFLWENAVTRPEAASAASSCLFWCHLVATGLKSSTWPKENRRHDPSQRPEARSVPRGSQIPWGTRQKHMGWRRDRACLRPRTAQPPRARPLPHPHTAHVVSPQTVCLTRLVPSPL